MPLYPEVWKTLQVCDFAECRNPAHPVTKQTHEATILRGRSCGTALAPASGFMEPRSLLCETALPRLVQGGGESRSAMCAKCPAKSPSLQGRFWQMPTLAGGGTGEGESQKLPQLFSARNLTFSRGSESSDVLKSAVSAAERQFFVCFQPPGFLISSQYQPLDWCSLGPWGVRGEVREGKRPMDTPARLCQRPAMSQGA